MKMNVVQQKLLSELDGKMKGLGMNYSSLCRLAKVHRTTVQKWQSGDTRPSLRIIEKLYSTLEDVEVSHNRKSHS